MSGRRAVTGPIFDRVPGARLLLSCGQSLVLAAIAATLALHLWQSPLIAISLLGLASLLWFPELRGVGIRRWWFAYVVGIFVYTILRAFADDLGLPVQTTYVIRFDRLLFGGRVSVVVLQDALFSNARLNLLDWLAVLVHWSFFVVTHVAAIAIFIWRRDLFARYTITVLATMYLGLALFILLPTSPPWLASQLGFLPRTVRVLDLVGARVNESTYAGLYSSLGAPNQVAAMPSIHMAVTFVLYLFARELHGVLAAVADVYVFAMVFSLVYLGEHYVLDLLVGMGFGLVSAKAAHRLAGRPRRAGIPVGPAAVAAPSTDSPIREFRFGEFTWRVRVGRLWSGGWSSEWFASKSGV